MPIIDLSHPIAADMPIYPGDPAPELTQVTSLGETGYVTRRLVLGSHTGTHIDAPAHMIAGATTLDTLPINTYCGPAAVLSVPTPADGRIERAALEPHQRLFVEADFVILNTGWHHRWGQPDYYLRFPALSLEAARWLVQLGLKGVGLDTPSADPAVAEVFAIHHTLFDAGMVVVENLTNLDILPDTVTFSAFPLALVGADGSPVRAVATW